MTTWGVGMAGHRISPPPIRNLIKTV